MAKAKISKSKLPFLKNDLQLSEETIKELQDMQEAHRAKFKDQLEAADKRVLDRYNAKIDALKKAKAEAVKAFDQEIKQYQGLVKELKKTKRGTTPRKRTQRKTK